jgi:hypothetical protein
MKRRTRNFLGTAGLVAMSLAVAFAPAPASAATQGSETFNGVLLASGATGSRVVLTTAVVMRGAFNGVGRIWRFRTCRPTPTPSTVTTSSSPTGLSTS